MKSVLNLYRIATNLMRTFFELVSQNFYVHYTNHILHEKKVTYPEKVMYLPNNACNRLHSAMENYYIYQT